MKVVNKNNIPMMTSLQIAEMLGSRHDTVKKSIERLIDKKIIQHTPLTEVKNTQGQIVGLYLFEGKEGKRDSIIAIAQLSPQHTAKLVDRWIELEEQVADTVPVPTDFLSALKALVTSEEEKVVIQKQLVILETKDTIQAPKAEYFDKVLDQTDLKTVLDVASKQGLTAQELNKILIELGVYDSRTATKTFKTKFVTQGLGKMVTARTGHTTPKLTIDGEVWVTTTAMNSEYAMALVSAKKAKLAKIKKSAY